MARRLGVPALLLARVGRDQLANVALDGPRRAGVDVSRVIRAEHDDTGAGLVIVGPDGEKTMLFAENANGQWPGSDLAAIDDVLTLADARSILVVDLDLPLDLVRAAVDAASARGLRVVLDPSRPARMADDVYRHCDSMTPDAAEAAALTGIDIEDVDSAQRAASVLCQRGAQRAFVKLDQGGCVVVEGLRSQYVAPPHVQAIDTTGAGDAFAGALACAMLEGMGTREAARMAVAAATLAVTREGTQESYPNRHELERMMARVDARGL